MKEALNRYNSEELAEPEKTLRPFRICFKGSPDDSYKKYELADYIEEYGEKVIGMTKSQVVNLVRDISEGNRAAIEDISISKRDKLIRMIDKKFQGAFWFPSEAPPHPFIVTSEEESQDINEYETQEENDEPDLSTNQTKMEGTKEKKEPKLVLLLYGITDSLLEKLIKEAKESYKTLIPDKLQIDNKVEVALREYLRIALKNYYNISAEKIEYLASQLMQRNKKRKTESLPPLKIELPWTDTYDRKKLIRNLGSLYKLGLEAQVITGNKKKKEEYTKTGLGYMDDDSHFEAQASKTDDTDIGKKSISRELAEKDQYEHYSYKPHARGGNSKPKRKDYGR